MVINCTKREIRLANGNVYPVSGFIANIEHNLSQENKEFVSKISYGSTKGVPLPKENTLYIVPELVMLVSGRDDLIALDNENNPTQFIKK